MKPETALIHIGQDFEPTSRAIVPPPYLTSTYVQESPGVSQYEYGRTDNPSFRNLEAALTAIEIGATDSIVYSSGTGAIGAIVQLLKSGDHILCDKCTYSGTKRLFLECYGQFGIKVDFADATNIDQFAEAVCPETQLIWIECPVNPLLTVNDIAAIASIKRPKTCLLIVDSTLATPINLSPLSLGADVTLHSTTKYISGHTDLIGGALCCKNQVIADKLRWRRNALGLNPSAFDCWLTQRSVKTLSVRMAKHQENAMQFAMWLQSQSFIKCVYYPGLPSFPQYKLANSQMRGFSGMISAVFNLSPDKIDEFLMNLRFFSLAESLGGVESMVDYPYRMTQSSLTPKERKESGVPNELVRFSIGIEDCEDLIEDVSRAITVIGTQK
tara:strand:- start:106 stop:1260 length:1155 start_codon:yes stop_codon:yes gene_type:complete